MRSYILVAAVAASGQLVDGAAVTWYEPADGVPLSGLESSQACESRGQRLCLYDELCPSGEDTAPVGMPSSHSDWMPFLSTTYGRRWMTGGCQVHEEVYDEGCGEWGCNTGSPCANECCDHGWCTTPGADGCDSASGSFNGYTGSCKGSYACCSEDETGYENACREWGYPKEGEWNVDEDCCAGKKQMACADGYRLENTGNVCYEDDCTTAYEYHCIADLASLYGDEDGGPTWMWFGGSESAAQAALDSTYNWDTANEFCECLGGALCTYDQMCATDNRFDTTVANHADFAGSYTGGGLYINDCWVPYRDTPYWWLTTSSARPCEAEGSDASMTSSWHVSGMGCCPCQKAFLCCDLPPRPTPVESPFLVTCDLTFNLDEDGEDYGCEDNVGLLILIICLPIGVVLICICIGCCICHRRRQAQQRQAQAAANAQMAHVQMAPVPTNYAYNTQQPVVQGAIVGKQQPVLEGVVVPSAPPIEPKAEEMYNQIAAWYNAPENAALRATWGAYPEPDEFQTWPGFVAVTNAFLDREAPEEMPPPWAPPAEEMPWAPPAEEMPPPAPPRNFCSACGAPVQGPFCGQCGARA